MKENNKLIAEFIGHGELSVFLNTEHHLSWNLLMPIIFKCQGMETDPLDLEIRRDRVYMISPMSKRYHPKEGIESSSDTMLKATWEAVVDYIKFKKGIN